MAFNAGELVATIRLDGVDRFNRDARSAGQTLERTGQVGQRIGQAIRGGLNVAAGATTAASAAAAAYMTTLFRTGAAYNTLQQTSRAALKTLLGSTEAVNDQMAQLDDFARNSPFSKATFIGAQQQLIGFGIEAKKVIPILGAVQDATAAVGGSNDMIAEIVSILAKISSSGKITAEDLNQLGARGLDAASLLGEGFGKSASDIRQDITDGALDAGKAIDVLTEQMTDRFGGAAANVKSTWSGAVDRIKAAQREIGATLAEPFISQQGGGMAVVWGNQVADVMRAVLTHTQPVVSIIGDRLAPAFAGITRGLDEARVVIKAWDSTRLESFLNQAQQYAPAVAALGGAIAGWTGTLLAGVPVLSAFTAGLNPLTGALAATALASPEVRAALGDLLGAFQPLMPVATDLGKIVASSLVDTLPVAADAIRLVADVARPLVAVLGEVPTPVIASVAAFLALRGALKGLDLARALDGFKRIGEQMAVQSTLAAMEGNTSRLAGAFGYAGAQATGFGNSLKAAFIGNPVGLALIGISTAVAAVIAVMSAQAEQAAKTKDAIAAYRDTLTETGDQTSATADRIRTSLEEAFDASPLTLGAEPLKQFGLDLVSVTDAIREGGPAYDGMLAKLREIGEETTEVSDAMGGTVTVSSQAAIAATTLAGELEKERDRLAAAEAAQRAQAEATRDALAAMTDAERATSRINDALTILRDTASTSTEKLSALKQILDELNGQTLSTEDAQQQLNDQVRSLADALAATDEEGNKLAGTLVDASGKIDTTTSAGSRLRDQVMGLRDAMLDSVIAADAQAKANGDAGVSVEETSRIVEEYSGRLREQAEAAGLSEDQIAGLIAQMDETPEVLAFAVTDDGTIDANQLRLIDLATRIRDTPDGDFEINPADFPGLTSALEALGYKIVTLPDGTVQVTLDGQSVAGVENRLNQIVSQPRTAVINAMVAGASAAANAINSLSNLGAPSSANGNLFDAGRAKAFENGGMPIHSSLPSAIYNGRPRAIYKFAEAETRWEAFISGKAGQEDRNRAIASEAVRRLGGVAKFGPAAGVEAFADGGIASAKRDVNRWTRELKTRQDWLKSIPKGHSEVKRAESSVAAAKRNLEAAKKAVTAAEEAASRRASFRDDLSDWNTGLRRGEQRSAGANGRGLSLVDEAFSVAKDLGGKAGASLRKTALASEKAYLSLERRAEATEKAVSAAQDRGDARKKAAQVSADALLDSAQDAAEARLKKAQTTADGRLQKAQDAATARLDKAQSAADARLKKSQEAAAERLQRITEKWTTAVDRAQSKLDDLRSAAASMASAITSSVSGILNLSALATPETKTVTDTKRSSQTVAGITLTTQSKTEREVEVPVSAGSIRAGLRSGAAKAGQFASRLEQLAKKGINSALLADIANLGPEQGLPIVDALLKATASDISAINRDYKAIGWNAGRAGNFVAGQNYGAKITTAEQALVAVTAKADAQIAAAERWGKAHVAATEAANFREIEAVKAANFRQIEAVRAANFRDVEAVKAANARQIAAAEAEGWRQREVAAKASFRQIEAARADAAAVRSKLESQTSRIVSAISAGLRSGTKRAGGGPIVGPGSGTSDDVLMWGSNGEWVTKTRRVQAVGGFPGMRKLDALIDNGTIRALVDGHLLPALAGGGPVVRVSAPVPATSDPGIAQLVSALQNRPSTDSARRGGLTIEHFDAGGMTPGEVFDELAWREGL